jgi:hypothetical protein
MIKRFFVRIRKNARGQSFLELSLVIIILALLLAGVVEFGFMLNNYFHILDAARESARFSSNSDPFDTNYQTWTDFYYVASYKALDTMAPIVLDPTKGAGDDLVISVFSMTTGGVVTRFPRDSFGTSLQTGWSLCAHVSDFETWMNTYGYVVPDAFDPTKWVHCSIRASQQTTAEFQTTILKTAGAPNAGAILVEVFYNYPQLLKLPVLTNVIADPIPVYLYSAMPLPAAAPTPTPP